MPATEQGAIASRLATTTAMFGGTLDARLAAMREAGFVATELWPRDLYEDPRGPEYALALLRDSGVAPCAFQALRDYEGTPPEPRARVREIARQMFDQMHWVGTDLLVLCTNMREDASGLRGRMVDDLGELAELARSHDIRIAYEHVCWGRHVSDYRDAWSLVREVGHDSLGIMLDSTHLFGLDLPLDGIAGIDPRKLFLVELGDIPRCRLPLMEIGRNYRLLPGEGAFDVAAFVRAVEAIGYTGPYSLEIMNAHYRQMPPSALAIRAAAAMTGVLAEALTLPQGAFA